MRIERITITPQVAAEMLERNIERNRPLKQGVVSKYSDDMRSGRWVSENGETIKIDRNGNLIDGQHRLLAVIKSQIVVAFYVAYGVDKDAFLTIDTGSNRTAGNIMHVAGEIDANKKAALVRNLIKLRAHLFKFPLSHASVSAIYSAYTNESSLIEDSYKFADAVARKSQVKLQASLIGSFVALINTDNVREFFHQVCTGRDVTSNVVHLLRDRLMRNASAKVPMPKAMVEEYVMKAYVYFKEGKEVSLLKLDNDPKQLFTRATN